MKKIGINYEVTYRTYKEFEVTDEQYEEIYEGGLPDDILDELVYMVECGGCDRENDWSVHDIETGKCLQDWK